VTEGGHNIRMEGTTYAIECPHCHKAFEADAVQGKGRIRGFKCPHCRLFVPFDRVPEQKAAS
jgi:NAD-dependent SIR2 family protein deacetylase